MADDELPIDPGLWRWAVEIRRDLHAHPELRFAEHRTAGVVAAELTDLGFRVRTGVAGTGVLAELDTGRAGPHVAVRADLDALPVPDAKPVTYRSTLPGVMHACGHDVHVTVLLTLARLLAGGPPARGRVTLLFQPAEEIPFGQRSGAQAVLDAGVLDLASVDAFLGLHCWPGLPAGTVGVDERVAMAAKDAFRIEVVGRGSHAALPAAGVDALLTASQFVTMLHQVPSRRLDPGEPAVLHVGTIHGGHSQSVVADRVELTGTIRTVREPTRARLRSAVTDLATGLGRSTGARIDVEWANEMPALPNAAGLVALALDVLPELPGTRVVPLTEPPMTTDDFALYARRVPALYLKLGVAGPSDGPWPPLHSPDFDVDERALAVGAAALREMVTRLTG